MNFSKDYYGILGIMPDAEDIVIRAAYKALSQKYHPDKFIGSESFATDKMIELNEAYSILSNPIKRKQYNAENGLSAEGKRSDDINSTTSFESEEIGHDPLYEEAVSIVLNSRRASSAFIQRQLKIGEKRAIRLIEEMEQAGLVSPIASWTSPNIIDIFQCPICCNSN